MNQPAGASRSLADAYPPPKVPISPILSFGFCKHGQASELPSIVQAGNTLFLARGSAAIVKALLLIGVEQGDGVLLPAYHCDVMIEAIRFLAANPVTYRINPDLSVDVDDLKKKIDSRSKVIIIIHYFGFPQDLGEIRQLCDDKKLLLIEDCAHSFFGSFDGRPPGCVGDYAVGSLTKFFPVQDGGCLVSTKHSLGCKALKSGGLEFGFRSLLNLMERAASYRRLRPFDLILSPMLRLKDVVWSYIKTLRELSAQQDVVEGKMNVYLHFDPASIDYGLSPLSRWLYRRTSIARLIERRRRNYAHLLRQLSSVKGCRPLMPDFPDTIAPYVFPLLVDSPELVFPILKSQGVPIYRWEDLWKNDCAISAQYSQQLLQLPCHQELRDVEVNWIADQVKRALAA